MAKTADFLMKAELKAQILVGEVQTVMIHGRRRMGQMIHQLKTRTILGKKVLLHLVCHKISIVLKSFLFLIAKSRSYRDEAYRAYRKEVEADNAALDEELKDKKYVVFNYSF